ncbi:hypothetical protein HHL16_00765 [Pseudoflavitalea sp. G-6-1-2]|uniref:hypothetical protein n=1 Tax=Pseudoflavitalea sp. G-6-1-2 TaxID=2728841 RepID=UPI00146DB186|nr:hypothetical protein [Pseudoflavitalea sp. G-6-1-2]NML19378.1 hypothetical protein [Pseudoflavitalea sp. G-6-1-2]
MKFLLLPLVALLVLNSCTKNNSSGKDVEVTLLSSCESEQATYSFLYNEKGMPVRVEKSEPATAPGGSPDLIYRELSYPGSNIIRSVGYSIRDGKKHKTDSAIFMLNAQNQIAKIDRMEFYPSGEFERDTVEFSLSDKGTLRYISFFYTPFEPSWILKNENIFFQNADFSMPKFIRKGEYEDRYTAFRNPFNFEELEKIFYPSFGYANSSFSRYLRNEFTLQQLCSDKCPSYTMMREQMEGEWNPWNETTTENRYSYEVNAEGDITKITDNITLTNKTKSTVDVQTKKVEWKLKYIKMTVRR